MTDNASIILALCSHMCMDNCKPLEGSEWTAVAEKLRRANLEPKDIPMLSGQELRRCLDLDEAGAARIWRLLDRSVSLGFALQRLSSMGIQTVTRADPEYPAKLKKSLHGSCPPLFYYAGALPLTTGKTVGFVGSRSVGEEDIVFTQNAVKKVVSRGYGVVSGGAKGVDSACRDAALEHGGFCVEYLADSLQKCIRSRACIQAIQEGRLVMLSAAVPEAGFHVGMAMQRNKYIYGQSQATVVIKSDYNKGGTWTGATEALRKQYAPVLCRYMERQQGNRELIRLGAIPITEDWDGNVEVDHMPTDVGEQLSFFD